MLHATLQCIRVFTQAACRNASCQTVLVRQRLQFITAAETSTTALAPEQQQHQLPPTGTYLSQNSSMATQEPATAVAAYDLQWVDHWKKGVEPGQLWDAGKISPALAQLLSSGDLQVEGKRVLVPGCGRGYDVFAFAQAGAAPAVGLDLCEKAIAAAAAERDTELASNPAAAARAELVSENFFSYIHHSGQLFDLGFDYTFLCALHPDMRRDWAQGWARVLRPGAELVTIVFPVGPGFVGNPPWQVSPELYQELLLPAGFEQVLLEPIPEHFSHKGRGGREWLGRWKRAQASSSSSSATADASSHSTSTTVSKI